MERLVDSICRFAAVVSALMFVATSAIIAYEVVARYAGHPTVWAQDLALYLMIGAAFLSQGYILMQDGHVRVDLVINAMPAGLRRLALRVTLAVSSIYVAVLVWEGAEMTLKSYSVGRMAVSLFRIPTWIPESVIPLGSLLLLIAIVTRIARPYRGGASSFDA